MHVLFTLSAILGLLFGIGVLQFVLGSEHKSVLGIIGAISLIIIGVVTILTSSVFPQDPQHAWDAPPTFAGQMHKILAMTVLPILSLLSTLTLGIWLGRTGIFPGFSTYSLITIGVTILAAILTFTTMQLPILGLTERITIIVIQQWTIVLSLKLFLR
jgi:hypothetical protein